MAKRKPSHILVIRLSALGDAAIAAPVVDAFADANPDVHFTVAAPPRLQPLFLCKDNVDFLGVAKRQPARHIARQLSEVKADAIADLHGIARVRHAIWLLRLRSLVNRAPLTIRHIHKGRFSRWLMLHHWCRQRRQQWQRYADTLTRLGLTPPAMTGGSLNLVPKDNTIGLAPFAQHPGKIWPWEYTCTLAITLAEDGYRVILFGSNDEAPQLEQLASRHVNITSIAGKYTFQQELDTIRHLALMVTMDSANMHFASAVGTPAVSIWGATHPDFGFYGYHQSKTNALCAHLPCQPCSTYGQRKCRYGDYRCLHTITPEQVAAHIISLLKNNNP